MAARDLAIVGLVGTLAYIASRMLQGGPLPVTRPVGSGDAPPASTDYLTRLRAAENRKADPYAKNPNSTASGLWQFVKRTWESVGGSWGTNLRLPFGGLRPTVEEQNARLMILTDRNGKQLAAAGIAVTNATLYAAHFLGAPTAVRALLSPDTTPMRAVASADQLAANPFLRNMTVAGFKAWLRAKMGS